MRTDTHKYIESHGVWDANELYDVQDDPREMHNRISTSRRNEVTADPAYEQIYKDMQAELARLLRETGARHRPTWRQ